MASAQRQVEKDLHLHTQELEALFRISRIFSLALKFEQKVRQALEELIRLVDADVAALRVPDENAIDLKLVSIANKGETQFPKVANIRIEGSLSGHCYREGQPVIVNDYQRHSQAISEFTKGGLESVAHIPLKVEDNVLGVITVDSYQAGHFTLERVRQLTTIADHMGVALRNATLEEEYRKTLTRQTALLDASRAVSESLDFETVLYRIAEAMCQALDGTSSYICDWDPEAGTATVLAEYLSPQSSDKEQVSDLRVTYDLVRNFPEDVEALKDGRIRLINVDAPDVRSEMRDHMVEFGGRSVLYIPLKAGGRLIGSAEVWESRQPLRFSSDDAALAESIAQLAANALENARLFEENQKTLKQQSALLKATQAISTPLETLTIFRRLAEAMCQGLNATSAYICDWKPESGTSTVLAEYYSHEASKQEKVSDIGEAYNLALIFPDTVGLLQVGRAWSEHIDTETLPNADREEMERFGVKSRLIIPIKVNNNVYGYAEIYESREHREFSQREISLAEGIALQSGAVIERAQLFQQVKESREQERRRAHELETVVNTSSVYLVLLDKNMTVRWINRPASTLFRQEPESLIGKSWYEGIPQSRRFKKFHERVLAGESIDLRDIRLQLSEIPRFLDVNYRPLLSSGGEVTGLLMIFVDVTDRVIQDERLREASRLASIGELAAGVAHELNNPLTSVIGFAELLKDGDVPSSVKRDAQKILNGGLRAKKIVQNLLAFARKSGPQKTNVDLRHLVRTTLDLKSADLRSIQAEVITDFDPNLPEIFADQHQMQQVFLNLINNAEQAMAGTEGDRILRIRLWKSSVEIRASFEDSGPGIPEDVSQKIFDPFFSTKEVGKGTGLGLSICYGILKEHDGRIWTERNARSGAIIHIALPLVSSATSGPTGLSQEIAHTSAARVLVVDDDSDIRELLDRSLSLEGYAVVQAADELEAKGEIESNSFDFIILDLKMPVLDGTGLYQWLDEQNSDLASKVIFITGDTIGPETSQFLPQAGKPILTKPFSATDLKEKMREVSAKQESAHNLVSG